MFTKEQRHSIYTRAYKNYIAEVKSYNEFKTPLHGLCYHIVLAGQQLHIFDNFVLHDITPVIHTRLYPELYKEHMGKEGEFFFPVTDTESRIKLLKQMIKETK